MEYEYESKEINLEQFIVEAGVGNFGLKEKGNKMWLIFDEPLSSADKTKLDNAIENHTAQPEEPAPNPIIEKLEAIITKLNSMDAKLP